MVRKGVYLTDYQVEFLEERDELSFAEHLRRSIDEYIERMVAEKASASVSKIIQKDGTNDTNPKK